MNWSSLEEVNRADLQQLNMHLPWHTGPKCMYGKKNCHKKKKKNQQYFYKVLHESLM